MADWGIQGAQWQAEFEQDGETLVHCNVRRAIYNDEKKRRAAFRWLASEASKRRAREFRTLQCAVWTLTVAMAAAVVGAVSIVLIFAYTRWP